MAPEGKEVLVETGSFTVDRARALEKLMRFALPDPAWGVLSLLRLAVASEAASFRVDRGPKGELTVRFGGAPPARENLEKPYDALFTRHARGDHRGRDLAVGLLSLLRLDPAHIIVRAGHGPGRVLLRLNRTDPETMEPGHDDEKDTIVRFMPGPRSRADGWSGLEPAFHERCAMLPLFILLDGESWRPPRPSTEEGRLVQGAGVSGWVTIPERAGPESRVRLYRHGVLAGEVAEDLGCPAVVGQVECAAFRLNASQTAVVRDPAYRNALSAVSTAAGRLVEDSAARHAERAPLLTQFLAGTGLRGLWGRTVAAWLEPVRPRFIDALGHILGAASEGALDRELAAALKKDARRASWLREAAARPPEGALAKAVEAARRAPVFLAPDLTGLSRLDLEATIAALGVLPVASQLNAAPRNYRVLWTATAGERAAAGRWFPGVPVSEADDAVAFEGRGGGRRGSLLARLGIVAAVARRPVTGSWEGELALPLQRPDAARVHIFYRDELAQSVTLEGPLRFVAAAAAGAPVRPQHARLAAEAVAKRLEDLYAGAATDWSPGAEGETSEALRAHLFDALAHWRGRAPAWLSALPLFQCALGMFHIRALEARLSDGDTLFFAPRHPPRPAPRLFFAHPTLNESLLRAMLPEARVAPLPLRPDWTTVWRPRAAKGRGGSLEALEDLLREHGTFLETPGSSERGHLLEALALNFAPWRGEPRSDPRWERVREHLGVLPLIRGAEGEPLTAAQVDARVALGRPFVAGAAPEAGVDLVLDEAERRALAALWPAAAALLREAPKAAANALPESAPRERSALAFTEPMLVAGEVEAEGLRALVGFPPDPLPGVEVEVLGAGHERSFVLETPGALAAGRMRLDVSARVAAGTGVEPQTLQLEARSLYLAFLKRFLEGGWGVDPASELTRPYLLMLATARKGPAGPWTALRRSIDALPLFPTLGGGTATLGDLRKSAAKGVLRCARRTEAAPPAAAGVPVVTTRSLVEAALGKAVHDWTPESVEPEAGEGLEGRLETLLSRVRGRKGVDPALTPRRGAVRVEAAATGPLYEKEGNVWRVNGAHEAARLALDESLDDTARAAYLLSALATAANRAAAGSTDGEDALFQSLLAEAAAEPE